MGLYSRKIWLLVIILAILLLAFYLYTSKREANRGKEAIYPTGGASLKIVVDVKDEMGHYLQIRRWNEEGFKQILKDEARFKEDIIKEFKRIHESYGVSIENCMALINKEERASILECDVKGFIYRSGNSYTAEFEWLLGPLGLDFLDNKFKESKDSLYWNGTINGTVTSVLVKLPPMNKPYAAWGQPNGHCHAHVWWKG